MKRWLRVFGWLAVIGCTLFAIVMPVLAIVHALFPWAPAVEHEQLAGQYLLCVGYSKCQSVQRNCEHRYYVLFPSVFVNPRIVAVTQTQNGDVFVFESGFALWFLLLTYGAVCFVAYRFGFRRLRAIRKPPEDVGD